MKINWIGNFQTGYVGEVADAVHIVREMEALGHTVQKVPQDIWKAFVEGETPKEDWVLPLGDADFSIIGKWHHFNGDHIKLLKQVTNAPVFYWVWDYMNYNGVPEWHHDMVKASDLYLANDVRDPYYNNHTNPSLNNAYYFPFDVADGSLPVTTSTNKMYDTVFFGSWIDQGNRQKWLREINYTNPITVFSWNWKEWPKEFNAQPAVYGEEFNAKVGMSKIVLGFSVEPSTWGYWSNRVGKVLLAGGFLLYEYAPGMELFLKDGVEYFSSIEEAQDKIDHFLIADDERNLIARKGYILGHSHFSSKKRVQELLILAERFIKSKGEGWKL